MIDGKKENGKYVSRRTKKRFEESEIQKFDNIYITKRPYQAKILKKKWHELYGEPLNIESTLIPPLQPEIDMILCKENTLIAVELKYFRKKRRGLDHSFYEGIEQSLALLRWGFDHVALWQLFEYPSITKEELWSRARIIKDYYLIN